MIKTTKPQYEMKNSNKTMIGQFYIVMGDVERAPLSDYSMHGYQSKWDFYEAVMELISLWHDRIGECIDECHDFLKLRFHDTPGGVPDEEWLPLYLLQQTEVPDGYLPKPVDPIEAEIDEAFGFS